MVVKAYVMRPKAKKLFNANWANFSNEANPCTVRTLAPANSTGGLQPAKVECRATSLIYIQLSREGYSPEFRIDSG
jgi:hypothetical protein